MPFLRLMHHHQLQLQLYRHFSEGHLQQQFLKLPRLMLNCAPCQSCRNHFRDALGIHLIRLTDEDSQSHLFFLSVFCGYKPDVLHPIQSCLSEILKRCEGQLSNQQFLNLTPDVHRFYLLNQ